MPNATSLPSANCHIPTGIHLFSIRLNISDDFTGTGAVSTLCALFPYGANTPTSRALSTTVFLLNFLLFILFSAVSIARYTRHPDIWRIMIRHPVQSLYLSTFPMGAATLIGFGTTVLYGQYGFGGRAFLFTLWALWWIDVAVSSLCCWGLVYVM
jgi:tellurite resistance protein TehA-like permease